MGRTLAWLKDTEIECATYSVQPTDDFNIYQFLAKFGGFLGKIHAKSEYIKDQKDHGRKIAAKLLEQVNKDKVNKDIVMIEEGEKELQLTLSGAKKFTDNLQLRLVIMKETERNIEESLVEWTKILHEYMDRYDDINLKYDHNINDLVTTVTLIKQLLSDFNGREDNLRLYDQVTQTLLLTVDTEASRKLNAGIQTFLSNWKLRLDNYTNRLQGLDMQLKKDLTNKKRIMTEWMTSSSLIKEWLNMAEGELSTYTNTDLTGVEEDETYSFHKLHENNFYLSEAVDKKLVKRLASEGLVVDEQLKRCSSFWKDGIIQKQETITLLSTNIEKFIGRKNLINAKLNHAKLLLGEMFEQGSHDDAIRSTFSDYEKYLYEKKGDFEDLQTTRDYSSAILVIEVMSLDMSKKSNDMESFITNSTISLSNNKYHRLNSNQQKQKLQAFLLEWREFEESLQVEKDRLEEKVNMVVTETKSSSWWLVKLKCMRKTTPSTSTSLTLKPRTRRN